MRSRLRGLCLMTAGLILVSLLGGCRVSIEMPADKLDYVGAWTSASMCLTITEQGTVSYERIRKSSRTRIQGPIKAFDGDDIVVGILFIKTTFEVEQPPYDDGGTWRMRVDGVDLVKTDSPTGCRPVVRTGLEQLVVACLRKLLGDQ